MNRMPYLCFPPHIQRVGQGTLNQPIAPLRYSADAAPPADAKKRKRKGGTEPAEAPNATDAEFGVARGVDFCDVTAVINMDLPRGLATYKHRVGRTARAGQGGTAISMVDENVS